jgi:hypothetical protein
VSKLRLGPIVDELPVKVTVEVPGELMRALADYAVLHARDTGLADPLSAGRLIVAMLDRFISNDRGFIKARPSLAGERQSGVAPPRR